MDTLRSKIIQPSTEVSILWFEFLLKPNLLAAHLRKISSESATDLISHFLSVLPENPINNDLNSPEIEKTEVLKIGKKNLALKILALKVAAHLKWNLDIVEKNIPLQKQVQLLSDLCSVTSGKLINLPLSLVHELGAPNAPKYLTNFPLTLYHRWVLRAQVLKGSVYRLNKTFMPIPPPPGIADQNNSIYTSRDDQFITSLEPFTQTSIDFLTQIMTDPDPFKVLIYESFLPLYDGESVDQKFENTLSISKAELKTQIYFDLCSYYMYMRKYEASKECALACRENLNDLKREYAAKNKTNRDFLYCNVNEEDLLGFLLACGVAEQKFGVLHMMNEALLNKYNGIIPILREDNLKMEIPLAQRKTLELDIEGAAAIGEGGKDLQDIKLEVIALNTIRYILDEDDCVLSNDSFLQKFKNNSVKIMQYFLKNSDEIYSSLSLRQKNTLKTYILNVILCTKEFNQIEGLVKKLKLFSKDEVDDIKRQKTENLIQLTAIATQSDWSVCDTKNHKLEVGALERQLITCTTANNVRKILVKLAGTNPTKPLWSINPSWAIPIPLKSIIMSLQRGFLQDFAYILLGKAKEFTVKMDYSTAIALLNVLKHETQRPELLSNSSVAKLGKLVGWEALLVQILQSLDEWPKKPTDPQSLIRNCKSCINSLHNGDGIIPRMEILEYCTSMLLNLNEWNSVVFNDKRFASLELCSAFAVTIIDIEKFKGTKKLNREAWDLVLPMFSAQSQKRQTAMRDSPTLLVASNLNPFLKKLRDPTIVAIVLSLLAKLHNVLKDESNLDINCEYLYLWPATISNANGYNIKAVAETLNNLLKQALKYYPSNIAWIKLRGDLEFANNNNEAAMKYYVTAIICSTEYCTLPLQRVLIDDSVIRRMIKCSSNLGCFLQATVLCQFLDDIDYGLAFKSISEKTSNFSDSMDAYYSCIWDATLLEFIVNLHSKKGEHKRRLQAISYLGQLELNANNNDEIKREASSVRKIRFLKSLAKQYML